MHKGIDAGHAIGTTTAESGGRNFAERLLQAHPRRPVQVGRYLVTRFVGEGGMGAVYEAIDAAHAQRIALKTIKHISPAHLYRFKNEFRAIARVTHPNVAALYELLWVEDAWFLVMEFVDGVSICEHVRESPENPGALPVTISYDPYAATGTLSLTESAGQTAAPPAVALAPERPAIGASLERLRGAMRQLALGVDALHRAGKLHRDLKPANVMVTRTGRVVVLDFGLVGDPDDAEEALLGTPAFMAPEQAAGQRATEASDWYAVGGILYEALTGRLPFDGQTVEEILSAKRVAEAPRPSHLVPGVPADLDDLCAELLHRVPERRPVGADVLLRLGATEAGHVRSPAPPLVGREAELGELLAAFGKTNSGQPVVAWVHGRSGMGKSALTRSFTRTLREELDVLVLEGRCYERESVPYKAFDGVIDALARHLARLSDAECAALLTRDHGDLARVFPVLAGVPAIAAAKSPDEPGLDPHDARNRTFRALCDLLGRMASAAPLAVVIEDLHWGDFDSALLVLELLSSPLAPGLLFIGTYRSDEALTSPFLREVLAKDLDAVRACSLEVGPLLPAQALRLAHERLSTLGIEESDVAKTIATEAGGSPLFVEELVRFVHRRGRDALADVGRVSLEKVLTDRISLLSQDAQRLLEIVAVAGQPIEQGTALVAAGPLHGALAALHALTTQDLLRTQGPRDEDAIETYHDRIRETVVARLSPAERAGRHLAIGSALENARHAEPAFVARHFFAGGDRQKAGFHALRGAERAEAALAFDRAAELYALTLEWGAQAPGERRALTRKRADALVNAGRCAESAPLYLACVEGASSDEALRLRNLAAEQLLVSGHFQRGVDAMRPGLATLGLRYPPTPRRALASALVGLVRLRLRGFAFRERAEADVPREDLLRVDACLGAARGLSATDVPRGVAFSIQALLLALEAGEPRRIATTLGTVGWILAFSGSRSAIRQGNAMLDEAQRIAQRHADATRAAMIAMTRGAVRMSRGEWTEALELVDANVTLLEEGLGSRAFECSRGKMTAILCLESLGRLGEVRARVQGCMNEAEHNGNIYTWIQASIYAALADLADDKPDRADARITAAVAELPRDVFLFQHWLALKVATLADLYAGNPGRAQERLERVWPRTRGVFRYQFVRIFARQVRAGVALALAARSPTMRAMQIGTAEREALALSAEGTAVAQAAASLVRAGSAAIRGMRPEAIRYLRAAIAGYRVTHMALFEAMARRCLGALTGGAEGRALVTAADEVARSQGICKPAAWARAYAPGFDTGDTMQEDVP